jgi:ADP-ribose pyrophosphatase
MRKACFENMMQPWKTLTRRVVLDQSPWLRVEQRKVQLPDGRVIAEWPWVHTPEYINVVVETDAGQFLCFRQRKYAIPEPMLALVGGYIEPGEAPKQAAERELREETGYVSIEWHELGDYVVDPNRGITIGHLFLARNAHEVDSINSDDLEEQEIVLLSREELEAALDGGEFKILAWAAAVAFALRRLD